MAAQPLAGTARPAGSAIEDTALNATEPTAGASEVHEPSPPPQSGAVDTAPADSAAATPEPGAPADIPRRPRRRRRNRNRQRPAAPSGETGTGGEVPPDATALPADAADPASDPASDPGADSGGEAGAEAAADAAGPARPILRLRSRRRRHRRTHAPGLLPGPVEGAAAADAPAPDAAAAASEPADGAAPPDGAPARRSFRVPRRRRRHTPLAAAPSGPDAPAGEAAAQSGDAAPHGEPGTGPARPRKRRRRRATPAGSPDAPANAETAERRPRDDAAPRRGGAERADNRRDGARDRGPRTGRDGGRDRRDGPPRRVERALYSVDSVVDRGFEDVEEDDGTRRVHWTIVKRTTADQISRKPVAAAYVLQRDGLDSEFPSLGAARNAVNKTIVHPEKLTRSKAEYAAEKAGKK